MIQEANGDGFHHQDYRQRRRHVRLVLDKRLVNKIDLVRPDLLIDNLTPMPSQNTLRNPADRSYQPTDNFFTHRRMNRNVSVPTLCPCCLYALHDVSVVESTVHLAGGSLDVVHEEQRNAE